MLDVILGTEPLIANEGRNSLLTHLHLVKKGPELRIVLRPFDFARHVGPFKVLDCFNQAIQVLLHFKGALLLRRHR